MPVSRIASGEVRWSWECPGAAADITAWVKNGGPGLAEVPDILDLYIFSLSRRVRHEFED
ncbi:hypothetical protein [Streptomyces sp. NPDC059262]|uniref:hypothetical protein n=1 Tax=Streptomyces sp. NPDC059262 TaxID=3346797 RepID=UPI0036A6651C